MILKGGIDLTTPENKREATELADVVELVNTLSQVKVSSELKELNSYSISDENSERIYL